MCNKNIITNYLPNKYKILNYINLHFVALISKLHSRANYSIMLILFIFSISMFGCNSSYKSNHHHPDNESTISSLSIVMNGKECPQKISLNEGSHDIDLQIFAIDSKGVSKNITGLIEWKLDEKFASIKLSNDKKNLTLTALSSGTTSVVFNAVSTKYNISRIIEIQPNPLLSINIVNIANNKFDLQHIPVSDSAYLKAMAKYSDQTVKDITNQADWSINKDSIASINITSKMIDGVAVKVAELKGNKTGSASVSMHFRDMAATQQFNIIDDYTLENVSIIENFPKSQLKNVDFTRNLISNNIDQRIKLGAEHSTQLSAIAKAVFKNGHVEYLDVTKLVDWSIARGDVASVNNQQDNKGVLTGFKADSTGFNNLCDIVSVKCNYGNSCDAKSIVCIYQLADMAVTGADFRYGVTVGSGKLNLTGIYKLSNTELINDQLEYDVTTQMAPVWKSSNKNVLEFNQANNGEFYAKETTREPIGVNITMNNGKSIDKSLKVVDELPSIEFKDIMLIPAGCVTESCIQTITKGQFQVQNADIAMGVIGAEYTKYDFVLRGQDIDGQWKKIPANTPVAVSVVSQYNIAELKQEIINGEVVYHLNALSVGFGALNINYKQINKNISIDIASPKIEIRIADNSPYDKLLAGMRDSKYAVYVSPYYSYNGIDYLKLDQNLFTWEKSDVFAIDSNNQVRISLEYFEFNGYPDSITIGAKLSDPALSNVSISGMDMSIYRPKKLVFTNDKYQTLMLEQYAAMPFGQVNQLYYLMHFEDQSSNKVILKSGEHKKSDFYFIDFTFKNELGVECAMLDNSLNQFICKSIQPERHKEPKIKKLATLNASYTYPRIFQGNSLKIIHVNL